MNIFKSILNSLKVTPISVKIAKKIKMSDLHEQLTLFSQNKTEFDFIGIYSNGDDCLYFKKDGNQFNIEFEAVEKSHLSNFEKIKNFATKNNYAFTEEMNRDIPCLTIKMNTNIDQTVHVARHIQNQIFGNNENTTYEIVP